MMIKKPILNCVLALTMLWIASLACSDYGEIDLTKIAPQDLSNMDLSWRYMKDFDFSNKNLSNVDFSYANLQNANFSNSNCQGANFYHANFLGANFSGAILDKKWELIIDVLVSGSGANTNFSGYDFSNAYMVDYDFSGANLQGANFQGANLVANFSGADLSGVDFSKVNLNCGARCTNFSYANLTNAIISLGQLKEVILNCTKLPDGTISGVYVPEDDYGTPYISIGKDELCIGVTPTP